MRVTTTLCGGCSALGRGLGLALGLGLAVLASTAAAQTFPTGPLRLIYPAPAGSGGDQATRLLAAEAEKSLGQPVVVENRGGGGGRVALNALTTSPGNGHTLVILINGLMVVLPLANPNFSVEPGKDYTPVTLAFESYGVLIGRKGLPYNDVKGLIAWAKANPGKGTIASSGTGGNPHLIAETLKARAGIDLLHVPYKGETPVIADMMAGQVDLMFTTAGAKPYIDAGKLVALGTTGPRRWRLFPDLPTMEEAGVPGLQGTTWWGIGAPPGTPPEVVGRLHAAFTAAMQKPEVISRMLGLGLEIVASTPAEFAARIEADRARIAPIMKAANIRLD